MTKILFSIVCIAFIVMCYANDVKRYRNVSSVIWIPYIWFLIISTRPVAQWFSSTQLQINAQLQISAIDVLAGNFIDRSIFIVLTIIGLCILIYRHEIAYKVLMNNKILLLIVFYCGISFMWSDFPIITLKRFIKAFGSLVMILIITTENCPISAFSFILKRLSIIIIPLSVLLIKFYREYGVFYGPWGGEAILGGVTTHKSALGRDCMILCLFLLYSIQEQIIHKKYLNKYFEVILLFTGIYLIIKIDSKTSLLCLIAGGLVYLGFTNKIFKMTIKQIEGIIISGSILFILLQYATGIVDFIVVDILGRDLTLTDRTLLWEDVMRLTQNPFLGAGYDSFWLGDRLRILWDKWWWNPIQAHNGYIDTYAELGLFGLFLILLFIGISYINVRGKIKDKNNFIFLHLSYIIAFLIFNITESSLKIRDVFFMVLLGSIICSESNITAIRKSRKFKTFTSIVRSKLTI